MKIFGALDKTDSNCDKFAEINIWPPINSRFIRIRPAKYFNAIAMRFDLYGPPVSRLEYARVVKYGDLNVVIRKALDVICWIC